MRFLLSVLLCLSASGADYVTHGRVIAEFTSIPANRVANLRQAITNQYQKADLFGTSYRELVLRTNDGRISGFACLDFALSLKASNIFATWQGAGWPNGTTGTVSMHFCAITNNPPYVPCSGTGAPTYFRRFSIP